MARAKRRSKKPALIRTTKGRSVTATRAKAYRSLKAKGYSTLKAARIANKGTTFAGRSAMAKKGAANR